MTQPCPANLNSPRLRRLFSRSRARKLRNSAFAAGAIRYQVKTRTKPATLAGAAGGKFYAVATDDGFRH